MDIITQQQIRFEARRQFKKGLMMAFTEKSPLVDYYMNMVICDDHFNSSGGELAKARFIHPNGKLVKLMFCLNMNYADFLKDNLDTVYNEIIPHEIAHLLCAILHPEEKGHGKHWKAWTSKLTGKVLPRLFNVDEMRNTEAFLKKRFAKGTEVKCSCRSHLVSKVVLNRILKKNKNKKNYNYTCTTCKSPLEPQQAA